MATVIVATAFGGPEVLSVVEREVPAPGPGEVTVEVRAAGLNPADVKQAAGFFGRDPGMLPLRLGTELSGVVTAVGPDAAGPAGGLRVGDEVLAMRVPGAFASEVTMPAATVVPKPAALSWEKAAGLLNVGATALHMVTVVDVAGGDTVLIHGASGGVGLTAAQLAVARGARVIGTASAARHEALRRYGVEPVEYGPGLAGRVRALAPGGVDAALDTVGTDEAVDVSLELLADRDRFATIVAFQRAAGLGLKRLGGAPGADRGADIRRNAWRTLVPLAASGALDIPIARTFPLKDTPAAVAYLSTGHPGGKVILIP